jgi:integrase
LTYAHIRAARPPASGRIELADTLEKGLRYRVTCSGSASWSLLTTGPDGRQVRVTLGDGTIPLARARQLAVDAKARLARGDSPTEAKRQAKAAERAARAAEAARAAVPTVAALARAWQEAAKADTSTKYRAEVAGAIRRAMGADAYETTPADAVTVHGFEALVAATRRREDGEARHLVAVARTLFGWAVRKGTIPADPMADWLAQQRDGRNRLPKWMAQPTRERVLDDAELVRLWEALSGGDHSAQTRAFAGLLLLTGCRTGLREHWTWHDLRRTAATGLARMGCPVHVTEAILNHVQGEKTGLARVYQRHDYRDEGRT